MDGPLRIAFVAPAYWPAEAFGGPVWVIRSLARELAERGHTIDVWTTTLATVDSGVSLRTRTDVVDGACVHYLATPLRYRWLGLTPTLGRELARAPRPDVAHVFGYRDPIGLGASLWFRRRGIPYVFEALGMFRPKLRKLLLKRVLDTTVFASLPRRAAVVLAASEVERREYLDAGIAGDRIVVRPNGFPEAPSERSGALRSRIGVAGEPLVLYVGRVADGKGIDLLVDALRQLPEAHLAVVGPDDGHGTSRRLAQTAAHLGVADRLHLVGPWAERPLAIYADADVLALPSAHENFGMAAAEAAAAGVATVVTDRCGVAELLRDHGALVVSYDAAEVSSALRRLLDSPELRERLGALGRRRATEFRWAAVTTLQESIYRRANA